MNLIFGYNGLGRISGSETGSVGGTGPGGSQWGPTGWLRFFNADFGTQISWLIPAAVILAVASLWLWRRRPRTDAPRSALLLWSGWLVVTDARDQSRPGDHPSLLLRGSRRPRPSAPWWASADRRCGRSRASIFARASPWRPPWRRRWCGPSSSSTAPRSGCRGWRFARAGRGTRRPHSCSYVPAAHGGGARRHVLGGTVGVMCGAVAGPRASRRPTPPPPPHTGAIPSAGPSSGTGPGGGPGGPGANVGGFPGGGERCAVALPDWCSEPGDEPPDARRLLAGSERAARIALPDWWTRGADPGQRVPGGAARSRARFGGRGGGGRSGRVPVDQHAGEPSS